MVLSVSLLAESTDLPISLKPLDMSSEEDVPEEGNFEVAPKPEVRVEELKIRTGEDINFLDSNESEANPLWTGTPRRVLDKYLPQIVISENQPALNALFASLILSGRFPQEGGSVPGSLSLKRAEILMDLGHSQEALLVLEEDLLSGNLKPGDQAKFEEAKFFALLSAQETDKACTYATTKAHGAGDAFWVKAGILCDAIQGESEKAQIRLEALKESESEKSATPIDTLLNLQFEGEEDEKAPLWMRKMFQGEASAQSPKDEILAELQEELQTGKTPLIELSQLIKTAPKDDQTRYFYQRLAKLFDLDGSQLGAEIPVLSFRQDLGVPQEDIDLLLAAAKAKRQGEVLLISEALLSKDAQIHPEVFIKILMVLKAAGYDAESQDVALDLVKAQGD